MSEKALKFWFVLMETVKLVNKLLTFAIGVVILLILIGVEGANWWQVAVMFGSGVGLSLLSTLLVLCYLFSKKGEERAEAKRVFEELFEVIGR